MIEQNKILENFAKAIIKLPPTHTNADGIPIYYLDNTDRIIHFGDTLEVKAITGGYGDTTIYKGKLLEIDTFSRFKMELDNGETRCIIIESHKVGAYDSIYLLNLGADIYRTSLQHGFGAYDVHSCKTYVKTIKVKNYKEIR